MLREFAGEWLRAISQMLRGDPAQWCAVYGVGACATAGTSMARGCVFRVVGIAASGPAVSRAAGIVECAVQPKSAAFC